MHATEALRRQGEHAVAAGQKDHAGGRRTFRAEQHERLGDSAPARNRADLAGGRRGGPRGDRQGGGEPEDEGGGERKRDEGPRPDARQGEVPFTANSMIGRAGSAW